jgi:hypothetical protein
MPDRSFGRARHQIGWRSVDVSLNAAICSEPILTFVTINVMVSGIVDWGRISPSLLPLRQPFDWWHRHLLSCSSCT